MRFDGSTLAAAEVDMEREEKANDDDEEEEVLGAAVGAIGLAPFGFAFDLPLATPTPGPTRASSCLQREGMGVSTCQRIGREAHEPVGSPK